MSSRARGKRHKASKLQHSGGVAETIYKLLARPVTITLDGQRSTVSTLEAILQQLYQKELRGDGKALAVRLKFEALAHRLAEPETKVIFLDAAPTDGDTALSREVEGNDEE